MCTSLTHCIAKINEHSVQKDPYCTSRTHTAPRGPTSWSALVSYANSVTYDLALKVGAYSDWWNCWAVPVTGSFDLFNSSGVWLRVNQLSLLLKDFDRRCSCPSSWLFDWQAHMTVIVSDHTVNSCVYNWTEVIIISHTFATSGTEFWHQTFWHWYFGCFGIEFFNLWYCYLKLWHWGFGTEMLTMKLYPLKFGFWIKNTDLLRPKAWHKRFGLKLLVQKIWCLKFGIETLMFKFLLLHSVRVNENEYMCVRVCEWMN